MTEVIHRYEVPVDDEWHELPLTGPVLHVACRRRDVVELWAVHRDDETPVAGRFIVIGTGQPFPTARGDWWHLGTAISPDGGLVWHLIGESRL